jgi:hypothetical protein
VPQKDGKQSRKHSISAADFSEFWALTQLEAAFPPNVWESGTSSVCRNTDEFRVPATAALIGGFWGGSGKRLSFAEP